MWVVTRIGAADAVAPGDAERPPLAGLRSTAAAGAAGVWSATATEPLNSTACAIGQLMPLASSESSLANKRACGKTAASDQLAAPSRKENLATSTFQAPALGAGVVPGADAVVWAGAATTFLEEVGTRSRLMRPDSSRCTVKRGAISSTSVIFATWSSGRTSSSVSLSPSNANKSCALASAILTPVSCTTPLSFTTGLPDCSNASFRSAPSIAC